MRVYEHVHILYSFLRPPWLCPGGGGVTRHWYNLRLLLGSQISYSFNSCAQSETDPPVEVPAPLTDTWLEIQELLAELDPVKLKKRRQEEMEAAALAASNAEAAAQSAAP